MSSAQSASQTLRGTVAYMSPELKEANHMKISRPSYNPFVSDVYSLGMTLLSMAALDTMKNAATTATTPVFINEEEMQERKIIKLQYSDRLKLVLRTMLKQDPNSRPNFKQLNELLLKLKYTDREYKGKEVTQPLGVTEEQLQTQLRALLVEKWKMTEDLVSPTIYLKQLEVVEQLAKRNSEAAAKAATYYFPYIPLSQVLTDFTEEPTPTLSISRYNSTVLEPVSPIDTSCGIFRSSDSPLIVRKLHNVITISEGPISQPSVAVKLKPHQTRTLLNNQIYRLGKNVNLWVAVANQSQLSLHVWEESEQNTYSFTFTQTPILIGRSPDCQICLSNTTMSTRHAEISWTGVWTLKDLKSTNGTWLFCHFSSNLDRESNEERVEDGTEVVDNSQRYIFSLG